MADGSTLYLGDVWATNRWRPSPPPSIAFNLTPLPPLFCAISRLVYGRFECICHASG